MPKKTTHILMNQWPVEDIYNLLMLDIEPELMTYMLPELPVMHQSETSKERRARFERYAKAFEIFAERFSALLILWEEELKAFKKSMLAELKEKSHAEDREKLSDIERSLKEK